MAGRILVGTSSWADPGFVKHWYPPKMPAKERLPWYAQRFELVELNSSFYAVPDRNTVDGWVRATPERFTFDVKLHRLLSRHAASIDSLPPELRDGARPGARGRVMLDPDLERALARSLIEETAPLAEAGKLGAFLLQLTPAFSPGRHELEELDGLVECFAGLRLAIELRHRGWVREKRREQTLGWYADRGVTFVCVDAPPGDQVPIMPALDAVTTDSIAYVRAHGRDTDGYLKGKTVAERFGWRYTDDELREIESRVETLAEQAGEVHVAFNNNRDDDAPTAAQRFRVLLGQAPPEEEQLNLGGQGTGV